MASNLIANDITPFCLPVLVFSFLNAFSVLQFQPATVSTSCHSVPPQPQILHLKKQSSTSAKTLPGYHSSSTLRKIYPSSEVWAWFDNHRSSALNQNQGCAEAAAEPCAQARIRVSRCCPLCHGLFIQDSKQNTSILRPWTCQNQVTSVETRMFS